MSGEVQFRAVKTGNMADIPPDLPRGEWIAVCKVKKAATSKDSFPMLVLEWKTVEALTDGNESFVGKSVTDFLVFYPGDHKDCKMGRIKLREICGAFEVSLPSVTEVESWDDLGDFVRELEGLKGKIYTTIRQRKDTGEPQTQTSYSAPRGFNGGLNVAADDAPKKILKKKRVA